MKRLSICLFFVFVVMGCSSKPQVVKSEVTPKDTDYLKYGTRASVIEQAWGKPDETMAFQDYQSNYSFWGAGGSWNRYGGSASGGGFSGTYTSSTIVWIYREKGYSLFFAQRGVFNEDPNPVNIKIWKLVGWQKLTIDQTIKPHQVTPPPSGITTVVTVTWTSANIRSGAGNEFPVLITMSKGDRLTVIGERGEWFNVRLEDGKEGWINSRAVK